MNRIRSVFAKKGHKALIAYIMTGYPSLEDTLRLVPLLEAAGCDIVELGIPFSDPLADGLTIQRAGEAALRQGVTPQVCLETVARLRPRVSLPLILMTYYNPVLQWGPDRFSAACAEAGAEGLIVPDLPPEESQDLEEACREQGLNLIYLLSPTSTPKRIALVARRSRGFIYLVSLTGVTGARDALPEGLEEFVDKVREQTDLPLCVGFGISTPQQAARVARVADGVILGSRLIEVIEQDPSLEGLQRFVTSLRQALSAPRE